MILFLNNFQRPLHSQYTDLQFLGNKDVSVILRGNNVTNVYYTRDDYYRIMNSTEESRATVLLDERTALRCDCRDYWAAAALRRRPAHVRLRHARCGAARLPDAAERLVCAAPALCRGAPPGCACGLRERPGAPARLLRLDCERAGLTRMPALPALPAPRDSYAWQLHLAHNRIAELRATDLPNHFTVSINVINVTRK